MPKMGPSAMRITLVVLVSLFPATTFAAQAQVSNVVPRRDATTGITLDVHDGTTLRIGDTFFWYGAGYGPCTECAGGNGCCSVRVGACGFNLNHTVNLATSTDLVTWTFHGNVLPLENRPEGILFGPWVAQSADTKNYVLWYNLLPVVGGQGDFDAAYYAVAQSASPYGPFTTVRKNVTGLAYTRLPDSPSIFVDDDGEGYIFFTHEDSHVNHVQRLTRDLLGPLLPAQVSAQVGPGNNEGALMFKRGNLYYVGYGQCCCFCGQGTNVQLWVASAPLGPYADAGSLVPGGAAWGAQTGAIWFTGVDWVLFGDRWQSAPGPLRKKSEDFSYWAPVTFFPNGSAAAQPMFQDNVTISY